MSDYDNSQPEMGLVLYGKPEAGRGDDETTPQISDPRETQVLLNPTQTRRVPTNTFTSEGLPARIQLVVRESGEVMECIPYSNLMIGRRNTAMPIDIDLGTADANEYGVSRNHARIEPVSNGLLVRDLESVNGSSLNGVRMHPMQAYELNHGDELKFGRVHLKVYFIYERNRR